MSKILEKISESAVWTIKKFANEEDFKNNKPYAVDVFEGNILCNEGINELWTLVAGTGGTKYDNTNAHIIVGTGTTAASASDTEATFTSGVKKGMDTGYPTYGSSQTVTFQATYGGTEANQAWNEFGVLNAATGGKLLNRKVSNQGTKASGQIWQVQLQITLA